MRHPREILACFGMGARSLRWKVRNARRLRGTSPDYVLFLLEGSPPELGPPRPHWWQQLLPGGDDSIRDLARHFERVGGDPRVRGIVLHLRPLFLPLAHLESLREAIQGVQAAGKEVIVWSQGYDTATYFLASVADRILIQPGGMVTTVGLTREALFLKDTLEEVGIEVDDVRISPYKSAPDMFTRRESTPEAREQAEWLLDDIFRQVVEGIAAGRDLEVHAVRALIDDAPYTDLQSQEAGIIDGILNEEALPGYLGTEQETVTLATWQVAKKQLQLPRPVAPRPYVALLRVEGLIIPGRSRRSPLPMPLPLPLFAESQTGDLTFVQEARALRDDPHAAAILLYVDSRGGSSAASEAIASALAQLAVQKPVVAVFGAFAASGGYYVATPAQWIVSRAGTLTGSIGVYAMKPVLGRLLDRLQVGRERLERGARASFFDAERPFNDDERRKLHQQIERTYDLFIERVSTSRGMSHEAVHAIAGGRVWTGAQALERGLVDELGGIESALAAARRMAGLDERAPLREVGAGRRPLAPEPPLTAREALGWGWNRPAPLLLCPLSPGAGELR